MATKNTSLAVKYRPQSFEEVCGQDVVKQILKHQIDTETFKQGYLFAGIHGGGKTTCARIFAKMINGSSNDIIEVDAATYNSVDRIREISEEAKRKPLVGKYKVFIIDECFSGNSLVKTVNGNVPIKDIKKGDKVFNLLGETRVKELHSTSVSTDRLCCVNTSSGKIVTTKDHLFFTKLGWIPACELREGDELVDYSSLQNLWSDLSSEIFERFQTNVLKCLKDKASESEYDSKEFEDNEELSTVWKDIPDSAKCECYNLLRSLWLCISQAAESRDSELCSLSDIFSMSYEEWEENMQSSLCKCSSSKKQSASKSANCLGEDMCNVRKLFFSEFRKSSKTDMLKCLQEQVNSSIRTRKSSAGVSKRVYEESKSSKSPRSDSENSRYKGKEGYTSYMDRDSWWQWSLYQSAVNAVLCAWKHAETRICDSDENGKNKWLSYVLQGRPSLSKLSPSDRGGWQYPFIEIAAVARSEENKSAQSVRVGGVTFYESGNREQSEFSCFDDSELDSGKVTMYDLTVEGAPSYIVNDILVHNCHMLSAAASNAFLKLLEEPPATSIFVLATTDPQKIISTILSRVQRFDFTAISIDLIADRLKWISEQEGISIDDQSVRFIAKLGNGSMRDAISLLDKVHSVSDKITLPQVTSALAVVSYHDHLDLLKALIDKDVKKAVEVVCKVADAGKDMKQFINQFMWCVCDVCNQFIFNSYDYINIPELPEYTSKISCMKLEQCLPILDWAKHICSDIRNDTNPKNTILVEVMLWTQR